MELTVVTDRDQLLALQKYWESVQWHPNIDFAQFRLVCDGRPEVLSPYVVVSGTVDRPRCLFMGRLERRTFKPRIGYLAPLEIPSTVLTILYQGVPIHADESDAAMLIQHLWRFLRGGGADVVELSHIPKESAIFRAFAASAPRFWSQGSAAWSEHWTLNLPSEVGGLKHKMRSKHRKWHDKKDRELLDAFPGAICWRWMDAFDDIPRLCAELETVASQTYQRALDAGFRDDEEHRQLFKLFAARNQLRVQTLEIDCRIRAFWVGLVYRGVFHSFSTAYDPQLLKYEPGNLLFHRLTDGLIREGVTKLDFGLGDAFYKSRFGDASWKEATVRVFAPSSKGAYLRSIFLVSNALDHLGRRLLSLTGFTDRLRTSWRRRMSVGQRAGH